MYRQAAIVENACAGTYRHLQARLRNNAESVAFYGGVEKEGRFIVHKFKDLLRHHERLLKTQWQYGMVQVSLCLCSLSNCAHLHIRSCARQEPHLLCNGSLCGCIDTLWLVTTSVFSMHTVCGL